ncbi:MAG: hypothetical protein AAGC91_01500 [Pseudomonadota bacterium]
MYANERWFKDPESRRAAQGQSKAVVDERGRALFYHGTGGMQSPARYVLKSGSVLFRFARKGIAAKDGVTGAWWMSQESFQKVSAMSQQSDISIAMAARLLCCIPPEWSDMGTLMRAKVREPLLAFRGLGRDVVISDKLGTHRLKAYNDISARRLYQLFIPGLRELAAQPSQRVVPGAIVPEQLWNIDVKAAARGFLYL